MNDSKDNKPLYKNLPFDQYSRQFIVSQLIDTSFRATKKQLKIIDLGGHNGKTPEFQQNDKVTILDVFDAKYPNYVKGDATKTTFTDKFFDIACSFDVFEHIPRAKRQNFIEEALRISKYGLFMALPIDVDGKVSSAEKLLNDFHKTLFSIEHPWLKEHIEYKIPTEAEIKEYIQKIGADSCTLSSNQLGDWQLLQMLIFAAAKNPDITTSIDDLNAWYNNNIVSLDSTVDVGYRKIFFISKDNVHMNAVREAANKFTKPPTSTNFITVHKKTFRQFSKTLAQTSKKYNTLFQKYQTVSKTKKELGNEIDLLKNQLTETQKYNEQLLGEINKIYTSGSWRVTKPLRYKAKLKNRSGHKRSNT